MADATTGVAHANARVSTMPKLSPPSEGATSAFADSSSAVRSSWLRKPRISIPSSAMRSRASSRRTESGSAPAMRRVAPVRRRISGQARRSTGSPLRRSWRPAKTMRCSRSPGLGARRDQDAVRDDLVLPRVVARRRLARLRRGRDAVVDPVGHEAPHRLGEPQPAEVAGRVPGRDDRAVPERERRDARDGRHRLVQVQDVEPLALEDRAGSGRSSAG